MAETQAKRKIAVSARIGYSPRDVPTRPVSPSKIARAPSPSKANASPRTPITTPTIRPRAKVSSSATVAGARKPNAGLVPGYASSGSTTPRASSPAKQLEVPHGRLSPQRLAVTRARSKTNLNLAPAASAPNSPRLGDLPSMQSSFATASSDSALVKPGSQRVRHASISSMSQLSAVSSIRANSTLSVASAASAHDSAVSPMRIKAKVSGLAKNKVTVGATASLPPPLQLHSPIMSNPPSMSSSPNPPQRKARTSSTSSLSVNEPLYQPISANSPSANVQRYATVRTASSSHKPQQPFTSAIPRIDPTLVPLPPLSPPSSTVSFSSQSSLSRISAPVVDRGTAQALNVNVTEDKTEHNYSENKTSHNSRPRSGSAILFDPSQANEETNDHSHIVLVSDDDDERQMRAEAKSNRKIADLEITNKSLLVINAQLEATKHKQAKEIRDLRRKLRESRLILPPRTYQQVQSDASDENHEDEEDPEEEADTSAESIKVGKEDELFNRVRGLIDSLLDSGKKALETKAEDFASTKGGTKVLHEVEAKTWRDSLDDSGARRLSRLTAYDTTFDESFVTAESEYGADELPPPQSNLIEHENNAGSEEEVESLVDDSSTPVTVES